ncbi:MAG: hypothetical protein ABFC57_02705 [Veillonellales bacterium]
MWRLLQLEILEIKLTQGNGDRGCAAKFLTAKHSPCYFILKRNTIKSCSFYNVSADWLLFGKEQVSKDDTTDPELKQMYDVLKLDAKS